MKGCVFILSIIWIFTKFNFLYGMEGDRKFSIVLTSCPYDFSSIKKSYFWKQNIIFKTLIYQSKNKPVNSNSESNLLTYILQFTGSSILPAFSTFLFAFSCAMTEGSFDITPQFQIGYTCLNCVSVPLITHFIGKLRKKEGNLYNSIIGTFLGSIPGWIISHYGSQRYWDVLEYPQNLSLLLMAFCPSTGGVIGYNLKF